MTQSDLLAEIIAAALGCYKDFDNPDFHFVAREMQTSPLRSVLPELNALAARVKEDTEPNSDVSFGYIIANGTELLSLRLSMVGPYAALRRIASDPPFDAIGSREDCRTDLELNVYDIVARRATILDRSTLQSRLKINLTNIEAAETTVYNALFTDSLSGL